MAGLRVPYGDNHCPMSYSTSPATGPSLSRVPWPLDMGTERNNQDGQRRRLDGSMLQVIA